MTTSEPDNALHPSPVTGALTGAVSFEAAPCVSRIATADDIDELGHVNNAVYLIWAQDIATAHWTTLGAPDLTEAYVWVALRHEIDYRDPILEGETAELRTWLGPASGPRFERHVDIRKPGAAKPSAKVVTQWCLVDRETRKPRRVGEDILSRFGVPG